MSRLSNELLPQSVVGLVADPAVQGARRATGVAGSSAAMALDPEVAAVAKRRQYSNAEKRRILSAADRCRKPGELGALLRREGIYSSMLAKWRKQHAESRQPAIHCP